MHCFQTVFRSHLNANEAGAYKFPRFEERFGQALFSWRISVDDRPNCRNKAVRFQISSG